MKDERTAQTPVTCTIDGQTVTADSSSTILEAASSIGIHIPTLCYHARLTSIGSCRVCLVKIEGYDAPVASCTTPVSEGIRVVTDDEELRRLRKQAIQLILLNHPLECPVCDKAGECELQDITYKLEVQRQDFDTSPETWKNDTGSPLIFRSDGRCIRCGRCVAICNEVQNVGAIDFIRKGYDAGIAPTNGEVLDCEYCGQCVSICPVGALLPKTFLNQMRVWDLEKTQTVCAFCGAGCSIIAHTRDNKLYRITSDREKSHNRGDLCVRGRFGFDFVEGEHRKSSALAKTDEGVQECLPREALLDATKRFMEIVEKHGRSAVAGIGSSRMLNEDAVAFSHFMRSVVGTPHLDVEAGLEYRDMHARMYGGPVGSFDDLEQCDAILVFGADLAVQMPVPALRAIAAAKKYDARIVTAAPFRTKLHTVSRVPMVYSPGAESALALAMAKTAVEENLVKKSIREHPDFPQIAQNLNFEFSTLCSNAGISEEQIKHATRMLFESKHPAVIVGSYGYCDEESRKAVALLSWMISPNVFLLGSDRSNVQGVVDAGCGPGENGLPYRQILQAIKEGQIKALWVVGSDPAAVYDQWEAVFDNLELLIVQDPVFSRTAEDAHFYLPVASWGQKAGTATSVEGREQVLRQFLERPDSMMTDAQVFEAATRILDSVIDTELPKMTRTTASPAKEFSLKTLPKNEDNFWLVRGASLFMNGTFSTHSLHLRTLYPKSFMAMSPKKLESLGLRDGESALVTTKGGSVEIMVKAGAEIPEHIGFFVDHFANSNAGILFPDMAYFAPGKVQPSAKTI